MALDETVGKVLDQAFAKSHQIGIAAADRLQGALDNIGEQTKILFLEEKIKVGTREAAAMQRMDDNKLAQNILAQRSVSDQPPVK
jgi:hypothetical protein